MKKSKNKQSQINLIDSLVEDAMYGLTFSSNEKYCTGRFSDCIPFININDVLARNFIIRADFSEKHNPWNTDEMEIIARYESVESLVEDGWLLD